MTLFEILAILFIHFVADFLAQTREQQIKKSKSFKALVSHTGLYSMFFTCFFCIYCVSYYYVFPKAHGLWPIINALICGVATFIAHTIQDYFSSRITTRLYKKAKWHTFFAVIGFDQFLHFCQLLITFSIFKSLL